MSEYLFIGGPANGQTREVEDNAAVTRYVSLPDSTTYATLTGRAVTQETGAHNGMAAVIHTYARRELHVTDDGVNTSYTRVVYAHDSIPSAQHLISAVMQHLLAAWITGGHKVQDGEVVSAEDVGSDSGA